MSCLRVFLAVPFLFAVGLDSAAQTTGNIRGTVFDESGGVLPAANVTIMSAALMGGTRTVTTNEMGVYRFPSLSVGTYVVEVSLRGFETFRMENVDVTLNSTANVNVHLKLATVSEAITVLADSPVVDVTKSGVSTSFKNEMVEDVPTYRNFFDYVKMAPGMSAHVESAMGFDRTVAYGSNLQSNSWNIDGIETSSPETGSASWYINPDNIEEVEVMGVGAPAEFGNAMGGIFNVVTKKGGNDFRGSANAFFQHDGLTDTNVVVDGFGFHRDTYRDITAQLGGPIREDRLWFFVAYEHKRDKVYDRGNDPSIAGAALLRADMFDVKISARLGNRHEIGGLFHWGDWAFEAGSSPYVAPSAAYRVVGTNPAWGVNLTSTISQNTLLEAKYAGWWGDNIIDSPTGSFEEPFIDWTPPGGGPPTLSGGAVWPSDYITWSHQARVKLTHYTEDFLGSQHEFKFGVQFAKGSAKTVTAAGSYGTYRYHYQGYFFRAHQDPHQYGGVSNDLGLFLDDAVTVNNHLTLNLGVRFDHNTGGIPDYERLTVGKPSIAVSMKAVSTGETIPGAPDLIRWNVISPRVGFAYQPRADGRSAIRGSFGVYYDQNVIGNWDAPPPGVPTFEVWWIDPVTDQPIEPIYAITSEDVAFHPNLRPPRTLQYAIGFERQFKKNLSAGVQYVYKETDSLVGWEILDGIYEPFPFTDPFTGEEYTLLSQVDSPTLRKGNHPGNFPGAEDLAYEQDYHGVVVSFAKRFANRWGLSGTYTWSRSKGLLPDMFSQTQFSPLFGSTLGSDPNNFINAYGFLQGDRPHMFRAQGVFRLPWDLMCSTAVNIESGRPFNRQIQVFGLGQGRSLIIMEPSGSRPGLRRTTNKSIDVMFGKRLRLGRATLKLDGTIYNLTNADNALFFHTLILQSPEDDFEPGLWRLPRRLMIRLGIDF
jgi:hypothetical protein